MEQFPVIGQQWGWIVCYLAGHRKGHRGDGGRQETQTFTENHKQKKAKSDFRMCWKNLLDSFRLFCASWMCAVFHIHLLLSV